MSTHLWPFIMRRENSIWKIDRTRKVIKMLSKLTKKTPVSYQRRKVKFGHSPSVSIVSAESPSTRTKRCLRPVLSLKLELKVAKLARRHPPRKTIIKTKKRKRSKLAAGSKWWSSKSLLVPREANNTYNSGASTIQWDQCIRTSKVS